MSTLKKIQPGDMYRPSATVHNETVDLLTQVRAGRFNGAGGRSLAGADRTVIKIRNETGSALSRFHVVGLGDPVIDPDENEDGFLAEIVLEGDTPATADHAGKFAIMIDAVPDGAIGRAIVHGVSFAWLLAADTDTHADIDDGETGHLIGGSGAAQILYIESGDAESARLGIIRIGGGGESERPGVITSSSLIDGSEDRYHHVVQLKTSIDANGQFTSDGAELTDVLNIAELDNDAETFNNGQKRVLSNDAVLVPEPPTGSVKVFRIAGQWYFDKPMPSDVSCDGEDSSSSEASTTGSESSAASESASSSEASSSASESSSSSEESTAFSCDTLSSGWFSTSSESGASSSDSESSSEPPSSASSEESSSGGGATTGGGSGSGATGTSSVSSSSNPQTEISL